jgi:hypothetical protein
MVSKGKRNRRRIRRTPDIVIAYNRLGVESEYIAILELNTRTNGRDGDHAPTIEQVLHLARHFSVQLIDLSGCARYLVVRIMPKTCQSPPSHRISHEQPTSHCLLSLQHRSVSAQGRQEESSRTNDKVYLARPVPPQEVKRVIRQPSWSITFPAIASDTTQTTHETIEATYEYGVPQYPALFSFLSRFLFFFLWQAFSSAVPLR